MDVLIDLGVGVPRVAGAADIEARQYLGVSCGTPLVLKVKWAQWEKSAERWSAAP